MLPLETIKKYYPNASEEELKEIQEVVYLLSCAVMQHFYGSIGLYFCEFQQFSEAKIHKFDKIRMERDTRIELASLPWSR